MTAREAQAGAVRRLRELPELRERAMQDAALLLRDTLGLSTAQLLAYPDRVLTSEQRRRFEEAITRRLAHEPVQYITGRQEFYGLELRVTPDVLIPRPETELLVGAVLSELDWLPPPVRVADVGTGSGAIAIALAANLVGADITAVDISQEALGIAEQNARTHGVDAALRLCRSDLLAEVPADELPFDAVVSNPPYIPEPDRLTLQREVRDYEPSVALFGGNSGLEVYRRLIPQARMRLAPGGLLAMEIGYGQRESIEELLAGWKEIRFLPDLQGISRTVLART